MKKETETLIRVTSLTLFVSKVPLHRIIRWSDRAWVIVWRILVPSILVWALLLSVLLFVITERW